MSEVSSAIPGALDALAGGDNDTSDNLQPLLELLHPDVRWVVDWKGDGVFTHSSLFGYSSARGHQAVRQFFDGVYQERLPQKIVISRQIELDDEIVVFGAIHWRLTDSGADAVTDFTLALLVHEGRAIRARLLTLPEGHIESFVPDHQHSDELDPQRNARLIEQFQKLYFDAYLLGKTWSETRWMGVPIFKCPLDLWIYQELINELKPDFIVETGTCAGGSALYLAQICDLAGHGQIITVDLQAYKGGQPQHERITYLLGSSTSDEIIEQIRDRIPRDATVMVVLDSDHSGEHVYNELQRYADIVSRGSYLIVEDSNLNGHPTKPDFGPGPMEAIDRFLAEDDRFRIDSERQKLLVTWNPRGYLLKR